MLVCFQLWEDLVSVMIVYCCVFPGENIQELIVEVLEAFGRALKVGHILKNFACKPLDLNS